MKTSYITKEYVIVLGKINDYHGSLLIPLTNSFPVCLQLVLGFKKPVSKNTNNEKSFLLKQCN